MGGWKYLKSRYQRNRLRYAAASFFNRVVIRLLYRDAVFLLMMPHFAARSTKENVVGTAFEAPSESFWSSSRRMVRIW